jgi:hypothetical protein
VTVEAGIGEVRNTKSRGDKRADESFRFILGYYPFL